MGQVPNRTVDDYLASLPFQANATLGKLRRTIKALLPESEEVISYGIPTVRYRGRGLVAYAAAKNHCTFHLMSTWALAAHLGSLDGYETTKGGIQILFGGKLPGHFVKELVEARIAENEAKGPKK